MSRADGTDALPGDIIRICPAEGRSETDKLCVKPVVCARGSEQWRIRAAMRSVFRKDLFRGETRFLRIRHVPEWMLTGKTRELREKTNVADIERILIFYVRNCKILLI